ncbi:hypothetical protein AB3S75_033705 [Citrus x aurantiifolia]
MSLRACGYEMNLLNSATLN